MPHSATYQSNSSQSQLGTTTAPPPPACVTHVADVLLGDSPEDGVQLQVLPSCQQLVDGVELGAVAHVLVDLIDLPEDAAGTQRRDLARTGSAGTNGSQTRSWTHLFLAKKASPLVTMVSPVSILKVVVFPAPFTPSSPKH